MLTPAHPLRARFTASWYYRRQLRRARLCTLLTGLVLAAAAVGLHGFASRTVWQSEGVVGNFVGVAYAADSVESPAARPAAQKSVIPTAVPFPSGPPVLAVSAELPAPAPVQEQELVAYQPAEAEAFAIEIEAAPLPSPRPAAEPRRAVATEAESPLIPPAYRETPKPPYPPALRARRISGSVGVRIAVSAEGLPTEVAVTTPGGHVEFERTVRRWILEHWRFSPARRGGVPVASSVQTRVDFVLD